jgi:hypothetical protein
MPGDTDPPESAILVDGQTRVKHDGLWDRGTL